ncbi:MAG TPA: GNAT family N-acetyltransferase [Steroidobacteraceae bacterium]|nr:GNAT family N-acetyltransferase [Steroidobacteraceae bacterium]
MRAYKNSSGQDTPAGDCRILKSIDDIVSIRTEWDRLWVDARAGYALSFSYFYESWNLIHRPQGAELCCVVAFENDRLLAALPMVLLRDKARIAKYAVICTPEAAEGCDILIERTTESPAISSALLKKFLISASPDVVSFFFVKSGCHLEAAIQSLASLRIIRGHDDVMPYADLKAEIDWNSYKRSLSKHYESNVARKTRRLHEQGKVTVDIVREAPTPAIEWLFLQKRKWSERTNKRGQWVFSLPYQEFITKLFASDPGFLVFILKLDDAPIAVKLAAIGSSFASTMMITYDEKYERFSPGNVLDEFVMRHIFENYRDSDGRHLDVDFGPGREHFKLYWSRGNVHPTKSFIIAASRSGLVKLRFDQICSRIRRLAAGFMRAIGSKRAQG